MELIDLQERTDLKAKYVEMNLIDFYWKYLDQSKFPNLRKFMASKMALFGSTYLSKQFFSKMGSIKSPYKLVLSLSPYQSVLLNLLINPYQTLGIWT